MDFEKQIRGLEIDRAIYGGKHHSINFEGIVIDDWTLVYTVEFRIFGYQRKST